MDTTTAGLALLSTFVGALISGFVTWRVAESYYQKQTRDLEIKTGALTTQGEELIGESALVRKLVNVLAAGLSNQGWITVRRDAEGNMTILDVNIVVSEPAIAVVDAASVKLQEIPTQAEIHGSEG